MTTTVTRLQAWFAGQCDGAWEHGDAIVIETIDNPGWKVKIALRGTSLEDRELVELRVDLAPQDWITCIKKDGYFLGIGDPSKLERILEQFLRFADLDV